MSNWPTADIHASIKNVPNHDSKSLDYEKIWIRLSREEKLLEISSYRPISPNFPDEKDSLTQDDTSNKRNLSTGEWIRRRIPFTDCNLPLALKEDEKFLFEHILKCRRICMAIEDVVRHEKHKGDLLTISDFPAIKKCLALETNGSSLLICPRANIWNIFENCPSTGEDRQVIEGPTSLDSKRVCKPRLSGLGLPPRPRRILTGTNRQTPALPSSEASQTDRKRSHVHWKDDIMAADTSYGILEVSFPNKC